jgi:succinate dehydrogenase hydrophobic anchor subunit
MNLRNYHRFSAVVIAAYACVHIVNHLVGLSGVESHIVFMKAARLVYRQPVIETVLLLCVAFQAASGLWMVVSGWKQRRGLVSWLQALSGTYLAIFFAIHIGAVMAGRAVLGLDTNFYYAAAGFHVPPFQYFFGPYYFLGVVALFTHLGCAAYWQLQARPRLQRVLAIAVPVGAGVVVSTLIVASLAGRFVPVHIPAEYKATYMKSAS